MCANFGNICDVFVHTFLQLNTHAGVSLFFHNGSQMVWVDAQG